MPAPEFRVDAERTSPYANFKFRVVWDARPVAGVSKVSGLTRTTEVISHREGGDPSSSSRSPGQTDYTPITLERGVTCDLEFEQWANKVWTYGNAASQEVSLKDFRKPITIELRNEAGETVLAYHIHGCWVSEFTAMPELDASGNAVAIQSITLQHEGWEREDSGADQRIG